MKPYRPIVTLVTLAFVATACSSSSTSPSPPTGTDASTPKKPDATSDATRSDSSTGAPDVLPDVIVDPDNCVAPGGSFSEKGVGGYCSPKGGQCDHAGTGGTPTICTADFGAPSHEWFCTITCTTTSDCGPGGGTCLSAPFGQFCVEAACAKALGDAGQGGFDAGVDSQAHDSGTTHDANGDVVESDAGTGRDAEDDAEKRDGAHDAPKG